MKAIYLSIEELNTLRRLETFGENVEAQFYFLGDFLLKIMRNPWREYSRVSLKNVNTLLESKDKISEEIPEFVLPELLVYIGKHLYGYAMQYINGVMLRDYLQESAIPFVKKIELLKKIGFFIDRFTGSNMFSGKYSLGDFHEDNIIVDVNGNIRIVDVNGLYLSENGIPNCRYIKEADNDLSYEGIKYERGGFFGEEGVIPSRETDMFCYGMMIMNFISQTDFVNLSYLERERYLKYLESINFSKEFLKWIKDLWGPISNVNPIAFLDGVTEEMWFSSSYKEYCKLIGKKD